MISLILGTLFHALIDLLDVKSHGKSEDIRIAPQNSTVPTTSIRFVADVRPVVQLLRLLFQQFFSIRVYATLVHRVNKWLLFLKEISVYISYLTTKLLYIPNDTR